MCIAAFSFGFESSFRLAFAANRDELHARPSAAADWWDDAPGLLGGRDLVAGGSWLAVNRRGWLAAVTNLPQDEPRQFPRSRGHLVRSFLTGNQAADAFAAEYAARSGEYGPCNLLVWDGTALNYAATGIAPRALAPGVHALGNAPLGTDWPRVHRAEAGFKAALDADDPEAALLVMLSDREPARTESADAALARRRTQIFITDERYGTRSSTIVLIGHDDRARFLERSFAPDGSAVGDCRFTFSVEP